MNFQHLTQNLSFNLLKKKKFKEFLFLPACIYFPHIPNKISIFFQLFLIFQLPSNFSSISSRIQRLSFFFKFIFIFWFKLSFNNFLHILVYFLFVIFYFITKFSNQNWIILILSISQPPRDSLKSKLTNQYFQKSHPDNSILPFLH